ncbi:MAG: hypothetical protein LUF33_07985 [Clostridiales bacterium]|nr:hypothetical protein [Clostridiales bacterium]
MKKGERKSKLLTHIIILALCLLTTVTAAFSWYDRSTAATETGNLLTYTQTGKISGEGCTVVTYVGTENNGVISYDSDDISSSSYSSLTTEPGSVNYFETVIKNNGTADCMISVYLEDFTYSNGLSGYVKLGLTQPEKTYKTVSSARVCLEDNLEIGQGETVTVDWFVEVDSDCSDSGSISLGTMHIVYN